MGETFSIIQGLGVEEPIKDNFVQKLRNCSENAFLQ